MTIWSYLSPKAKNQKTYKMQESKVPLFLYVLAERLRYGHIIILDGWQSVHISVSRPIIKKTTSTLLSSTFKIYENKV